MKDQQMKLITALILFIPFVAQAASRQFVVAAPEGFSTGYDSFVVELSNDDDIAYARNLMRNPSHPRSWGPGNPHHLTLTVKRFPDGINRDYLRDGAPAFDWHVSGLGGFTSLWGPLQEGDELNVNPIDGPSAIAAALERTTRFEISYTGGYYTIRGEVPFQQKVLDPDGTARSSWFGVFNQIAWPWIDHQVIGWIYVYGLDPQNIWMQWSRVGQVWTSEEVFPLVYVADDAKWYFYEDTSMRVLENPGLYLFDFENGEWKVFQ